MKRLKNQRFLFYVIGLFILTFGISATIASSLGASPFDALLVGLYKTFGLTVGSWEVILAGILLIMNSILQKKKPEILAMMTAFLTGVGIDFWLWILDWIGRPEYLVHQVFLLSVGIICIGLGIAAYLQAKFAPAPLDGTMLIVRDLLHVKVSTSKNIVMLVFLLLAYVFNGPIGIGTLIMAVGSGPCVGFFFPLMEKMKEKIDRNKLLAI